MLCDTNRTILSVISGDGTTTGLLPRNKFTVTPKYEDCTKASRSQSSLVDASFKMPGPGTHTMISCVVVVCHLRGLICAVGPMGSLISIFIVTSLEGFNDWGGRGCDDFVPGEVTKTPPSGDRTT